MWAFLTLFHVRACTSRCARCRTGGTLSAKERGMGRITRSGLGREGKDQVRNEIVLSLWSIAVMTFMIAPFELMVEAGWTKLYWDVDTYTACRIIS